MWIGFHWNVRDEKIDFFYTWWILALSNPLTYLNLIVLSLSLEMGEVLFCDHDFNIFHLLKSNLTRQTFKKKMVLFES